MEKPCYKCGAAVEEGVPFCPNCNAPQIRIAAVGANEPATPPLMPGTPGEVQPPAEPASFEQRGGWQGQHQYGGQAGSPYPATGTHIQWSDALPGAMVAGALIALSWLVPPISFLLWPVAAGALAVMLYLRRRADVAVTPAIGARVGAIAGLFGFLSFAILMAFDLVIMRGGGKLRQAMEQVIQQSAARNPSPEAQAMMQKLLSPEGVAVLVTVVLVIFLACFVGFGAAGGAIGAKLLTPRRRR